MTAIQSVFGFPGMASATTTRDEDSAINGKSTASKLASDIAEIAGSSIDMSNNEVVSNSTPNETINDNNDTKNSNRNNNSNNDNNYIIDNKRDNHGRARDRELDYNMEPSRLSENYTSLTPFSEISSSTVSSSSSSFSLGESELAHEVPDDRERVSQMAARKPRHSVEPESDAPCNHAALIEEHTRSNLGNASSNEEHVKPELISGRDSLGASSAALSSGQPAATPRTANPSQSLCASGNRPGSHVSQSSVASQVLEPVLEPVFEPDDEESGNAFSRTSTSIPTPKLEPFQPVDELVDIDIRFRAGQSSAQQAAQRLLQTVLHSNISHRLFGALNGLFSGVTERAVHDATKFGNAYQQMLEICGYILKDECSLKPAPFTSGLRTHQRRLVESFVTLIKTAPTFVAAALLSMSASDLDNFVGGTNSNSNAHSHMHNNTVHYPDVSLLNRMAPLDILFYTIFPPDSEQNQRDDYFANICAALVHNSRGDNICFAIFDRFVDQSGHGYRAILEQELLKILQQGGFLIYRNKSLRSAKAALNEAHAAKPGLRRRAMTMAGSSQQHHRHYAQGRSVGHEVEENPADEELRLKRFLDQACEQILACIDEECSEMIPFGLLRVTRLILAKTEPSRRRSALLFIVSRYFFGKHLNRLMLCPERAGMLCDYFLSEADRHRILGLVFQTLHQCMTEYANNGQDNMEAMSCNKEHIRKRLDRIITTFEGDFAAELDRMNDEAAMRGEEDDDNGNNGDGKKTVAQPTYDKKNEDKENPRSQTNVEAALNLELDVKEIMTSAGSRISKMSSGVDAADEVYEWDGEHTHASTGQIVVVTPSDIVCLYSALFPSFALHHRSISVNTPGDSRGRKPSSVTTDYSTPSSTASIARSSGGQEIRPQSTYDMHQNLHLGSATEVTASTENTPVLQTPETSSPSSFEGGEGGSVFGPTDDSEWSLEDIKLDLQPVMEELIRKFPYLQHRDAGTSLYSLRPQKQAVFRVPHPLAEKWQLFQLGEDGTMHELNLETYENSIVGDSDDAETATIEPGTEEYFPVPQAYKNLVSVVVKAVEKIVEERSHMARGTKGDDVRLMATVDSVEKYNYTMDVLSGSMQRSAANGKFVDSYEYSNAMSALKRILALPGVDGIMLHNSIVQMIGRAKEKRLEKIERQVQLLSERNRPYKMQTERARIRCEQLIELMGKFRNKVWYATEIRGSNIWKRARDVALALTYGDDYALWCKDEVLMRAAGGIRDSAAAMPGQKSGSGRSSAPQLRRNSSTSSIASLAEFTFKRLTRRDSSKRHSIHISSSSVGGCGNGALGINSGNCNSTAGNTVCGSGSISHGVGSVTGQIGAVGGALPGETNVNAMFAPLDLAGKFKLNDKESQATQNWLEGQQIQNFCTGEELIHRFCCEVDDLVKRVMGDTLSPNHRNRGQSMLSSSGLFRGDIWKSILEIEGTSRGSSSVSHAKRSSMIDFGSDGRASIFSATSASPATPSMGVVGNSSSGNVRGHGHRSSTSNVLDLIGTSLDFGRQQPQYLYHHYDEPGSISKGHFRSSSDDGSENFYRRGSVGGESKRLSGGAGELIDGCFRAQEKEEAKQRLDQMILEIQMTLIGLIYTDLGVACFYDGAPIVRSAIERELDQQQGLQSAIKAGQNMTLKLDAVGTTVISRRKSRASLRKQDENASSIPGTGIAKFDFGNAYCKLLDRLSVTPSPLQKLKTLHELEMLVVSSLSSNNGNGQVMANGFSTPGSIHSQRTRSHKPSFSSETVAGAMSIRSMARATSINGLTSLGEAIATVEARRSCSGGQGHFPLVPRVSITGGPGTDTIAEELRRIFRSIGSRSKTLFRDLQFIAAFVPPQVLDLTDMGKAFWDVSLAALSFKEEILGLVVDFAAEIFQYKTGMIGPCTTGSSGGAGNNVSNNAPASVSMGDQGLGVLQQWGLADCAWLWTVASKEGDVGGQRELAIMHMSHPDLTPITLIPFSKVADVFGPSILEDFGRKTQSRHDKDKYDPIRMAIIKHWMSSAARYGDAIAVEYLNQQGPYLV